MMQQIISLVQKFHKGEISKSDLAANLPITLGNGSSQLLRLFYDAIERKDSGQIEYLIVVLMLDPDFYSTAKYVEGLNQLLISDWHYMHENISMILTEKLSTSSIDYFFT